jgi:hypothetical protein
MASTLRPTVFIPPKEMDYITLKGEYGFDERNLGNQFITAALK